MPFLKKLGRRALAVPGYLAAGVLLAELIVRIIGLGPQTYSAPRLLENSAKTFGLECYPTNPDRRFPIDLRDRSVRERVSRQGQLSLELLEVQSTALPHCVQLRYRRLGGQLCRAHEALRPGVAKVLLIGDSFTEGAGVASPKTFARRLEQRLDKAGHQVQVVNCGRRGRDLPALRDMLFRLLPVVKPAVVVYAFMLNDFEQDVVYRQGQTFQNDLVLRRIHMGAPTWKLPWWLRWSRLAVSVAAHWRNRKVTESTIRWYQAMTGPRNRGGWSRTRRDLAEMSAGVKRAGGRFLVAVLPLLFRLDGSYPFRQVHRDLARACKRLGIEHLDLLPAFLGKISKALWVHPVDMHPNGTGHRIIARALQPRVDQLLTP